MEQEHPIPQQISAYQFRLVGDMTLNQFFQVAGGALLSLAIYSSSLPTYFKWPLMVVTFLMGIAFAFFPFQDRPLATWLVLFFKAIYSPTIYVWRQGSEKREFFVSENTATSTLAGQQSQTPAGSTTEPSEPASVQLPNKLETGEAEFLSKVERQMESPNVIIPPPVTPAPAAAPPTVVKTPQVQPAKAEVKVVPVAPIKVEVAQEEIKQTIEANMLPSALDEKFVPAKSQTFSDIKSANFIPEASPPLPPSTPNVIVGQVLDPNGKIIDSAILEILDPQGRPLRALKSNKLGHFMIVTPLANGIYNLVTERDGYSFEPVQIEAKGETIAPIAIFSKNVLTQ